jgi:hypothetical protein
MVAAAFAASAVGAVVAAAAGGAHPGAVAKASPNYLARAGAAAAADAVSDGQVLQRQYTFVRWLSQTLMDSLYPGALQAVFHWTSNTTCNSNAGSVLETDLWQLL